MHSVSSWTDNANLISVGFGGAGDEDLDRHAQATFTIAALSGSSLAKAR